MKGKLNCGRDSFFPIANGTFTGEIVVEPLDIGSGAYNRSAKDSLKLVTKQQQYETGRVALSLL